MTPWNNKSIFSKLLLNMFSPPTGTGKISNNLYVVRSLFANFFVYKDGKDCICIDSGLDDQSIPDGMEKIGVDPNMVSHVFLSHSDFDHAGGLRFFPNARVYLSRDEEPMINGRRRRFSFYHNPKIRHPYELLLDNHEIRIGNIMLRAITTPGHTCGSMSYVINDALLFSGCALRLHKETILPMFDIVSMDTEQAKKSIYKLAKLENISILCTAHFGYSTDFKHAKRDWV